MNNKGPTDPHASDKFKNYMETQSTPLEYFWAKCCGLSLDRLSPTNRSPNLINSGLIEADKRALSTEQSAPLPET